MGQKVHPNGIRLGITKPFASTWFASTKDFAANLHGDHLVREYLTEKLKRAVEKLRLAVSKIAGVPAQINIAEVRKPEMDSQLVADSIASQLERRVMFRRAMKRAVQNAMRLGAKGIKVQVSGRLGGADIARAEWYREGRVPLHTLRADIDYSIARADTTYGVIGIKVWIFKGEVIGKMPLQAEQPAAKPKRKPNRKTSK